MVAGKAVYVASFKTTLFTFVTESQNIQQKIFNCLSQVYKTTDKNLILS